MAKEEQSSKTKIKNEEEKVSKTRASKKSSSSKSKNLKIESKPKNIVKTKKSTQKNKVKSEKKDSKTKSVKSSSQRTSSKKEKLNSKKSSSDIKIKNLKSKSSKKTKVENKKQTENPFDENYIGDIEPVRFVPNTSSDWFEETEEYKIIKQPLPQRYKVFLALVLTVVSTITIIGASLWFNQFLPNTEENNSANPTPEIQKNYINVSLIGLDVYSENWAKQNFSEEELSNSLISGPSGDFDNDDLTNLEEYLLGTDPKKKVTFCPVQECTDTDGKLFKADIHPISKLKFITDLEFVLEENLAQDFQRLKLIFERVDKQDINFTQIYSQQKSQNLETEIQETSVNQSDNVTFTSYQNKMKSEFTFLQNQNSLSLFLNFYENESPQAEIDILKSQKTSLEKITAPTNFSRYHRINNLIIEKLIKITEIKRDYQEEEKDENKDKEIYTEDVKKFWSDVFHLIEEKKKFE